MLYGLMSLPLSDSYLPSADFEMPTSAESCSNVSFCAVRKSFKRSPIVSLTCIHQPPFLYYIILFRFCLKAWKNPAYRQLLADCDKKFKEYEAAGCQTYFNKKDHLWTLYEYETGAFKIPETVEEGMIYGGCNCGNCHLTILPTGDVYACRRVQNSKVANVFTDRLADVWVCQMEQYRDYTKFEKCSKCELLAFCRGCPAVASGKDGNFYAADPQCWKEIKKDA